ncbi:hypothetical protein V7S43_011977 [Phytophthora oleae]|uniref:Uncharacterized protein n=1 Tax=Phytophthora oleae TaxID=2107226 RepID=A0ABD3F994_9STRA
MSSEKEEEGLSPMEFILRLIDGLDEGAAKEALLKMTVEKAFEMDGKELLVMKAVGSLWKWVIRSGNKTFLESLTKTLMSADTSETGLRFEDKIEPLDTKFSWEKPNAEFPDNEKIQAFLRGPEASMTTNGVLNFDDYWKAHWYSSKQEQKHCSFKMKATEVDRDSFLMIIKTRDWFLARQKELV